MPRPLVPSLVARLSLAAPLALLLGSSTAAWGAPTRVASPPVIATSADTWLEIFRAPSELASATTVVEEGLVIEGGRTPNALTELVHELLDRPGKRLYLLGDDRLHVVPRRLGIGGWGLSAGGSF